MSLAGKSMGLLMLLEGTNITDVYSLTGILTDIYLFP